MAAHHITILAYCQIDICRCVRASCARAGARARTCGCARTVVPRSFITGVPCTGCESEPKIYEGSATRPFSIPFPADRSSQPRKFWLLRVSSSLNRQGMSDWPGSSKCRHVERECRPFARRRTRERTGRRVCRRMGAHVLLFLVGLKLNCRFEVLVMSQKVLVKRRGYPFQPGSGMSSVRGGSALSGSSGLKVAGFTS